jgi:acetyl-CoA decarbonylase/synthase complex subunit alpha
MTREEKKIAKVGNTEIDITRTVRDIRGIESLVKECVETTWSENQVNQIKVWLTPYPHATDIAEFDKFLLDRYPPVYTNIEKTCNDCPLGPCDLDKLKGICGLDLEAYQAKLSLQASCRGLASVLSTCRDLLNYCIREYGEDAEVKWGKNVAYGMMNVNALVGFSPRTLGQADKAVTYMEDQLAELLASASGGFEGNALDLQSKALHGGSLLLSAMDIIEFLKFSFFGFYWSADQELKDLLSWPPINIQTGLGTADTTKPVIVFLGFDFLPAWNVVKLVKEGGMEDKIEICGIGSVGHDMVRFYDKAKILTTAVKASRVLRMGIADVLVISDSCSKTNILGEAARTDTRVIATSFKHNMGLTDRSEDNVDVIVNELLGGLQAVLITVPEKAAEVALKVAERVKAKRKRDYLLSEEEVKTLAAKCDECDSCFRACPNSLQISRALKAAAGGDLSQLYELHGQSIYCGRCEEACPQDIPIIDLILGAARKAIREDKSVMRAGRGTFSNLEVRDWAITAFSVPVTIGIIGCGSAKGSEMEVASMANEFIANNYAVSVSGCVASEVARYRDPKTGKSLYEIYPALLNPRCFVNTGGCMSQSEPLTVTHYKVEYMGFRTPYRANYSMQSDSALRFSNALVIWGAASEIMYNVALGHARVGIPVIVGPDGFKFKTYLMGNKYDRSKWWAIHGMAGDIREVDPVPEHMIIPVETVDEVLALVPKLGFVLQEMEVARQNKFTLYLDYYRKKFGVLPDDWHLYIRKEVEIPTTKKVKLLRLLAEEHGWEIDTKKGRIIKARHRDGRLLPVGDYVEEYGFKPGQYATYLPRLVYGVRKDRL